MAKTDYTLLKMEKSYCNKCGKVVTLLTSDKPHWPAFFICWNCKRVAHVGVGRVRKGK